VFAYTDFFPSFIGNLHGKQTTEKSFINIQSVRFGPGLLEMGERRDNERKLINLDHKFMWCCWEL